MEPQSLNLRDVICIIAMEQLQKAAFKRKLANIDKIENSFDNTVYALVTPVRTSVTAIRYKKD